jgi:hypothetical protein
MMSSVMNQIYFHLSFYKDYHSNKYIKQPSPTHVSHQKGDPGVKKDKQSHQRSDIAHHKSEFPPKTVDYIAKTINITQKDCLLE